MTNEKVIRQFILEGAKEGKTPTRNILNGIYEYQGSTLTIVGDALINYSTVILTRLGTLEGIEYVLNGKKYSRTTSKIQSLIRRILEENDLKYHETQGE